MSEQRYLLLDYHRWLLIGLAVSLCLPLGVSLYFSDGTTKPFVLVILFTLALAGTCWLLSGRRNRWRFSSYTFCIFLVASAVLITLIGSLPYIFTLPVLSFTDAWFESVSGFTSTGATIFADPAELPPGLLVWRSLTQWIGGGAFILIACWALPVVVFGGQHIIGMANTSVLAGRSAVWTREMFHVLGMYIMLTPMCIFFYLWTGLDLWSAFHHGLTTVSLGGFSIEKQSFASFHNTAPALVAMLFMILASIPAARTLGLTLKNISSEQYLIMLSIIVATSVFLILSNVSNQPDQGLADIMIRTTFTATSLMTGTGYRLDDYALWHSSAVVVLLMLMIIGGCSLTAGSGLKVFRIVAALRMFYMQIRLLVHSRQITSVHIEHRSVDESIVLAIMTYIIVFLLFFVLLLNVLVLMGLDVTTAIGSVAATLGNVGPGLGDSGPFSNYEAFSNPVKMVFIVAMLLGRIEILPVLFIFLPSLRP